MSDMESCGVDHRLCSTKCSRADQEPDNAKYSKDGSFVEWQATSPGCFQGVGSCRAGALPYPTEEVKNERRKVSAPHLLVRNVIVYFKHTLFSSLTMPSLFFAERTFNAGSFD